LDDDIERLWQERQRLIDATRDLAARLRATADDAEARIPPADPGGGPPPAPADAAHEQDAPDRDPWPLHGDERPGGRPSGFRRACGRRPTTPTPAPRPPTRAAARRPRPPTRPTSRTRPTSTPDAATTTGGRGTARRGSSPPSGCRAGAGVLDARSPRAGSVRR